MPTEQFVTLPSGRELTFPEDTPKQEVLDTYYLELANDSLGIGQEAPKEKEQAGFSGAFKEGITSILDVPEAIGYLADPSKQSRKSLIEQTDSAYKYQDFYDIFGSDDKEADGLGGLYEFSKELVGGSLGQMALPLAAGAGTAAVTGPLAPVAGPLAFIGTAGLQYLGQIADRQARLSQKAVDEGKDEIDPNVAKVVGASIGSGVLDRATLALFPNISKVFGQSGKKGAEEITDQVVAAHKKDGMKGAVDVLMRGKDPSIAFSIARGSLIEGVQEVAQTIISRAGAEDSLFSQDAVTEYIPAFAGGLLLGGGVGGVDTAIRRSSLYKQAESQANLVLADRGIGQAVENKTAIDNAYNSVETLEADESGSPFSFTRDNLKETLNTDGTVVRTNTNPSKVNSKPDDVTFTIDGQLDAGNKSINDTEETFAVFSSGLSNFKGREKELTNKSKSRDNKANEKSLAGTIKMLPTLKTLARKIITNATVKPKPLVGKDKKRVEKKYEYLDSFNKPLEEIVNETDNGKFTVTGIEGKEFESKGDAVKAITEAARTETKTNFNNAEKIIYDTLEAKKAARIAAEKKAEEDKEKVKKDFKKDDITSGEVAAKTKEIVENQNAVEATDDASKAPDTSEVQEVVAPTLLEVNTGSVARDTAHEWLNTIYKAIEEKEATRSDADKVPAYGRVSGVLAESDKSLEALSDAEKLEANEIINQILKERGLKRSKAEKSGKPSLKSTSSKQAVDDKRKTEEAITQFQEQKNIAAKKKLIGSLENLGSSLAVNLEQKTSIGNLRQSTQIALEDPNVTEKDMRDILTIMSDLQAQLESIGELDPDVTIKAAQNKIEEIITAPDITAASIEKATEENIGGNEEVKREVNKVVKDTKSDLC